MRKSRIYSLANMVSSKKHDFYDKVFCYTGIKETEPLRLWLISPCRYAEIRLDDMTLTPIGSHPADGVFAVDYGSFISPVGRFGQLRIRNISDSAIKASYLILTDRLDWVPMGNREDIERSLWGLSRKDAGFSSITPSAVPVGEAAKFRLFYRPSISLPVGSHIRLGVPTLFSRPQNEDPDAKGFIKLCGAFQGAKLAEVVGKQEGHERRYAIYELTEPLDADQTLEVCYHTERVYLYPQVYDENEMEYWYTRSPVLNVSVALPGREDFVFLPDACAHRVEFLTGKPEKLHLFLPGRLHEGELITLHGLFTDKYHNPCPKSRPNLVFDLYLRFEDHPAVKLTQPVIYDDFIRFHVDLSLSKPGIYRVLAVDADQNTVAVSNPFQLLDASDPRLNLYWGEIHAHCGMSDGIGEYTDLFAFGRDFSALDFAASADHACYFSDNEWEIMQDICNSFNRDGEYTTLVGYEWAGKQVHRNIYTYRNRLELFRGMYEPTSNLSTVYDFFHSREDVVAGPHGSIAHGIRFDHHNPDVERFIEIYSMWGDQDRPDGEHPPMKTKPISISVNALLKCGAHLGFTGGGDCHEGHPGFSSCDPARQGKIPHAFSPNLRYRCGLTASCMDSLNRKNLIHALRERHTYATTGARMIADFSVNGHSMGEIFKSKSDTAELSCEYHLTDSNAKLAVIRNGEEVFSQSLTKADGVFSLSEQLLYADRNEVFYYVKITQSDGHCLWTTPIWITK